MPRKGQAMSGVVTHMRGRQAALFRSMLLATLAEERWAGVLPTLSPDARVFLDRAPEPEAWVPMAALVELSGIHADLGGPETSRARGSLMAEILHGDLPDGMGPVGFLQALPHIFQASFQGGSLDVALMGEGTAFLTLHGRMPLPGLTDRAIPSCLFTSLKQAGALSVVVDLEPPAADEAPFRYRVRWF